MFDSLVTTACPAALWDPMERQLAGLGTTARLQRALTMGEPGSDRSLVPYYVQTSTEIVRHAPRLLKHHANGRPGLAEVVARGFDVRCLIRITDVDTVPHLPITAAQRADVAGELERYSCCYYYTRRGLRVIQVLSRWLTPAEYEVTTARWIVELQALLGPGWHVDTACKDWTRHFRLPNHGPVTYQQSTPIDPGDCRQLPKPWKTAPVACVRRENMPGTSPQAQGALRWAVERIATAPEGDRHTRIFAAAAFVAGFVGSVELHCCLTELLHACPDDHERACRDGYARGLSNPRVSETRKPFDLAALRAQALAELRAHTAARIAAHADDDGDITL